MSNVTRYELRSTDDSVGLFATDKPNTSGMQYVTASAYDALLAERDALRDALEQAAQSLESISKLAGRDEFMQDVLDIRGFANSRATVARAALQGEQP